VFNLIGSETVVEVQNLSIAYDTRKGEVEAVRDVSFLVKEGETVGLVGESGCGKSTIAYGMVNFLGPNGKITHGQVRFQGQELSAAPRRNLKSSGATGLPWYFRTPCRP
jgi:peptide/nickel transport system ATP-binding protein